MPVAAYGFDVPPRQIVGLSLVRDEDLFIDRVLRNALALCDRILVADNGSRDETAAIVERLARDTRRIELHSVDHPGDAHDLVAPLAGDDVWVFGVDGDEVYDPHGLSTLREQILRGELDEWFSVSANAVHCVELDRDAELARGYPAPPARGLTKLYNFAALASWDGPVPERLHGGEPSFRAGYDASRRNEELFWTSTWETATFRCLHLCFVRRSSLQRAGGPRPNPMDRSQPLERIHRRLARRLRNPLAPPPSRKRWGYAKGDLVTISTAPFLGEGNR